MLLLICSIAVGVYWPGVYSTFLLDDYNLKVISEIGGINDLRSLWRYLASDLSGITGRPISNLSFLINYNSWPTSPFPFKVTNLVIHCCCGILLYLFVKKLLDPRYSRQHSNWVALFVTAYWVLNPLNVSTTLYVIQRMAMLSAMFAIIGLILYIHGRKLLAQDKVRGYIWMTTAIILCTSLAIMSKENGALLPILILTLEYTVIRYFLKLSPLHRIWQVFFLWLPTITVVLLTARYSTPAFYAERSFTLSERLLTESRVLLEYLYYWFNPLAISRGVLASDYPLSTNLLSPWTTLPALFAISGSILWAVWKRHRYPLASFAILFFFAGHLMESTGIPLEIYFEHRNYLPAVFLALPIAHWVVTTNVIRRRKLLTALTIIILGTQAFQTLQLTKIWGNDLKLAAWWAHHNPNATRAQDYFASTLSKIGRHDLAVQVLEKAILRKPENSHYYLHLIFAECKYKSIEPNRISNLMKQLSESPVNKKSYPLLEDIVTIASSEKCKGLSTSDVLSILDMLTKHKDSKRDFDSYGQLMHMYGATLLLNQQPKKAIESFTQSQKYRPNIQTGLEQVALLGTHRHYNLGLSWLKKVGQIHRPQSIRESGRSWDIDAEIEHLRTQLLKDLAKSINK